MVKVSEEITQKFIGDWLKENDYVVRFEVKVFNSFIDVVAIKENEITAIEVKENFYGFKDGIIQCLKYSKCAHNVFLAFPEIFLNDLKNKYNVNDLPFGLIVVDEKGIVKIIKESKKFKVKEDAANIIIERFKKSMKDIKETMKMEVELLNTPEIKRIIKKITTECLWLYLLTLLFREPCHAYGFKKEIEKKFKFSVGMISIYKVIYLLERRGFIEKVKIKHKSGGPERKYYKITSKGIELLSEGRDVIEEITNKLLWDV